MPCPYNWAVSRNVPGLGDPMSYCAFQVFPPSCVAYCRWSLAVIVAFRAPAAVIPIQSGNFPDESAASDGGAIFFQCPPSVVRAMAPLRPTIQEILSETAVPASQSSCDGLVCKIHVRPASAERWMFPPFPARQRIFPVGAFT